MAIIATNAVHIARFANALYATQLGSVTNAQVQSDITATGGLDNALNAYYAYSFGGMTTAQVAGTLLTNLGLVAGKNGLTQAAVDNASLYIVGVLNAAAPNARGAAVKNLLNQWANISDDANLSATYGAAATAWNGQVTTAQAYTLSNATDIGVTEGAAIGKVFTLTTSADNFTGGAANDTFNAGESIGDATWTVGDALNGDQGTDTLSVIQTAAVTSVPVGFTATSIENLNVLSGGAITMNTAALTDTVAIKTTNSAAAQTITGAATQNLSVNAALVAAGNAVSVDGGKDVSITSTGVTTSTTTVGNATAPAGAVTVKVTNSTGGTTTGQINVTGGTTVDVTSKAANAVGTTVTQSAVVVTGKASTTAVTVTQDAAATAAATVVGKVAGTVTVNDASAGSATAAGTIASVTLNSYANSTIDSSALTTVTLSGTGGTLGLGRGALTATPTANTLTLNVSGLKAGAITDSEAGADDGFTTINVASTGTASTIADLVAADATKLNVSGDAKVTFTAQTVAGVTDITVTNTAGASFGTALGNAVNFVGGAGADAISIGASTKAINMGGGNDVVTLSSATLGAGGTLNGGEGTDTLVANTNGSAFIADPAFGGFETLRVAGAAAQGSHNANGFTALEVGATANATTFTSVALNTGLTVLAAPTGGVTVTLANATGTSDVFGLTLKSDGNLTAGSVTVAGVETINITNTDSLTTVASGINTNTLTLVANAAKAVTVSGNAGLTVTNDVGNTAITSFDASGVQGASTDAAALAVSFTSNNATVGAVVTITGGSGNDALTGNAANKDVINGGAGDDTLTYTGGDDQFTGGAGADTFVLGAVGTSTSYLTITDASVGDKIDFVGASAAAIVNATLGAKVTLGSAATLTQYLNEAAKGTTGNVAGVVQWFQYAGDTYIVLDNSAAITFQAADSVVKLTGLVDLSTSALVSEVLTLA